MAPFNKLVKYVYGFDMGVPKNMTLPRKKGHVIFCWGQYWLKVEEIIAYFQKDNFTKIQNLK